MTPAEIDKTGLPSTAELDFDGLRVPANRRGADSAWYDVFALGQARYAITIGTVAGGQPEAVALMQALRDSFGAAVKTGPGTLFRIADAAFRGRLRAPGAIAAATIGILDSADQTFTYLSAGDPPPFLRYVDGSVTALPSGGAPFGPSHVDHPCAEVVVDIRDAALLVLSSGLLVPASANLDVRFGRLHDVLADERIIHCGTPAHWIGRRMLSESSRDDVALLALTFRDHHARGATRTLAGGESPRWSVSWAFDATGPASTGARRAFIACLSKKHHASTTIDIAAAELIFGELLGNVVRHAPGLVEITLDWTDELPVLHVLDNGPGFRSRRSRERLPIDDLSESGRGLFIVNACATKFSVRNRNGRGTHASATLPAI